MKKYLFYTWLLAFAGFGARADDTPKAMAVKFINKGGTVQESVFLSRIKQIRFSPAGIIVEQKSGTSVSVPFATTGKVVFEMMVDDAVSPLDKLQTSLRLAVDNDHIAILGLVAERPYALKIFDLAGQVVYTQDAYRMGESISTSQFVQGVYLIRINNQTLKFIKP